jgi:hypothetical protein
MKQTKLSFGEQCYNFGALNDVIVVDVQSLREIKDRIERGYEDDGENKQ